MTYGWFSFSLVILKLTDHGMSFSPSSHWPGEGIYRLETHDLRRTGLHGFSDACQWSIPSNMSTIHPWGRWYTNGLSSWVATRGSFHSILTWFFILFFLLKVMVGTPLLLGISCLCFSDHNTEEGVWRAPAIVPRSLLRALVVGIKSASPDLLLFQPL